MSIELIIIVFIGEFNIVLVIVLSVSIGVNGFDNFVCMVLVNC